MLESVDLLHYEISEQYKPSACIQFAPLKKTTLGNEKMELRTELKGSKLITQAIADIAKEFNGFSDLRIKDSCDGDKTDLLIELAPYIAKRLPSEKSPLEELGGLIGAIIVVPYILAHQLSFNIIPLPYMKSSLYILDVEILDRRNGVYHYYAFEERENLHVWLLAFPVYLWQESNDEPKSSMWKKMVENLYAAMFADKFFNKPENQQEAPKDTPSVE